MGLLLFVCGRLRRTAIALEAGGRRILSEAGGRGKVKS
jgi:hypothetical protein